MSHKYWILAIGMTQLLAASVFGCSTSDGDNGPNSDGDSDSDSDGDSDSDSDGDADNNGQSNELTGVIRDFQIDHPDFEYVIQDDRGIVENDLGSDGKPVYAHGDEGTPTTTGPDNFDQWFNNVKDINQHTDYTVNLDAEANGVYAYDNTAFFPIDDELFGNEGNNHNYHFTLELHTKFTYLGGEVFSFRGDDDVFVFINKRLAIDIGGVHGPQLATVNLDAEADNLNIKTGEVYTLDFFFAERHTTESNFRIETTISDLSSVVVK